MEEEGILLKVRGDNTNELRYSVLHDALAGHLIASTLIGQYGGTGVETWIRDQDTTQLLVGRRGDQHPLGWDTVAALTGLIPRQPRRHQLWNIADGDLRRQALLLSAGLEGAYLDADTVSQLETLLSGPRTRATDFLFGRLWTKRGNIGHPLNASFLDRLLRGQDVSERDQLWTEWLRARPDEMIADVGNLEARWHTMQSRSPADILRATWFMWTLTSTNQVLRDSATRALYWFGRGDPASLFNLTLLSLEINDAYVPERMLAAAYGVVMAHQQPDIDFESALGGFLERLRDAVCEPHATTPTNHQLQRTYIEGCVILAARFHPRIVPLGLLVEQKVPFAAAAIVTPITDADPRNDEIDNILRMDFENYTVGRLFHDRGNYDRNHTGHQAAIAHIRGTAWELGWRQTELGAIDHELSRHDPVPGRRSRVERYGKKYGWIGLNTYAGILRDSGTLDRERLPDVHLDPSFPEPPPPAPIEMPTWPRPTPTDDKQWIKKGVVSLPNAILYSEHLGGHAGPWVLVDGYLDSVDGAVGRHVFGLMRALLVSPADTANVLADIREGHPANHQLSESPSDHYTFAEEIPWHPEFASGRGDDPTWLYRRAIRICDTSVEIEILSHDYAWESYHSPLDQTGGGHAPSRRFSDRFDLRGLPQTFDQSLPDGSTAALVFRAPKGFDGRLLYLREDLVAEYAQGRNLIWSAWGERSLRPYPSPSPSWLDKARRDDADLWRTLVEENAFGRSRPERRHRLGDRRHTRWSAPGYSARNTRCFRSTAARARRGGGFLSLFSEVVPRSRDPCPGPFSEVREGRLLQRRSLL
jgi:hypothetical protein